MFDIYLSTPDVGPVEQDYVLRSLQSGWVAPVGPDLTAFEDEIALRAGRTHAVGLLSGTAALYLALLLWGVGRGDVVWTSTVTFAATANAIRYVGAEPFFVRVDAESGNASIDLLRQALDRLRNEGALVRVVIPVDLLGNAADYRAIEALVVDCGIKVLSNAAEWLGTPRSGFAAGSFGDGAAISFNGNTILATSGVDMLVTDDEVLARHVRKVATQAREPFAHYEHAEVGYNCRLSNILAALGRGQLIRFDGILKCRREIREIYCDFSAQWQGARILGGQDDLGDNCWLTAVVLNDDSRVSAADLAAVLTTARTETRPIWKPMHMQPVWFGTGGLIGGTAETLFARGLTIPSGSGMSTDDNNRACDALARAAGL